MTQSGEAGNIQRLVAEMLGTLPVRVVDSSSTDSTAAEAQAAGAEVI